MNIIQMSLSASVLIVLNVVIRSLALNKFPKKMFLILWGIAMIRLVLPITIPVSISWFPYMTIKNDMIESVSHISDIDDSLADADVPSQLLQDAVVEENMPAEYFGRNITLYIYGAWAVVAMSLIGSFVIYYKKSVNKLREALPLFDSNLEKCVNEFQMKQKVRLFTSDQILTPITFGVIKPKIVLPSSNLLTISEENTMRYVLTHELVHIKNRDNLWKLVSMIIVCIHWFNPIVWIMCVLFNRDLELACDEKVMKLLEIDDKEEYALTLIRLAENQSRMTFVYSGFGKNALKERIISIMSYKKKSIVIAMIAVVLVCGAAGVFITVNNQQSYNVTEYEGNTSVKMEWWTAEEYAKWVKSKKEQLQSLVGSNSGYYDKNNVFHEWTQEEVDKNIAMFESVLEEIEEGKLKIPKSDEVNEATTTTVLNNSYISEENSEDTGEMVATAVEQSAGDPIPSERILWIKEFNSYGLTIDEKNQQLYFNGNPIYFFADNHAMDGNFSGSVFSNGNGLGTTGVITVRDARGNLMGLQMLNEKESKKYSNLYW